MRAMRRQLDASRSLPARYRSTAARMMSEGVQSPSAASSTIRSYLARSSRTVQCLLGVDKPGLLAGRLAGSQELLAIIAEFGTANKIAVVRVSRARGMSDELTRHIDRKSTRLNSSH